MTAENVADQLALQNMIRRYMGRLVRAAERDAALLEGARMDKSQLQNVLNVAEESRSVEVVTNFILYQIGRAGVGNRWQHNNFGVSIVAQIVKPEGVIEQTAQAIRDKLAKDDYTLSDDVISDLRYELMRYYLGYLLRAYVFGTSGVKNAWHTLRELPEHNDV
jgi:hypothetical protein